MRKAVVDGVTFSVEVVDDGIEYCIEHPSIGKVAYTLSTKQILTRRFLEDQALGLLVGNRDLQDPPVLQEALLQIVEAG